MCGAPSTVRKPRAAALGQSKWPLIRCNSPQAASKASVTITLMRTESPHPSRLLKNRNTRSLLALRGAVARRIQVDLRGHVRSAPAAVCADGSRAGFPRNLRRWP